MSTTILKDTKQQSLFIPSDKVQFPEDLILADYIEEVVETLSNIPIFEFNEETGELNIVFAGSLIETKLDYFWIENLEDEEGEVVFSLGSLNTINNKPVTLEYSIDRGESWTEFNTSSLTSSNRSLSIAIPAKTTMYLKGNNECFGYYANYYNQGTKITCSKQHNIGGNLISLLSKDLVEPETLPKFCFACLFYDDKKLIDASKLIMLSKTGNNCYRQMFYDCTSLTTAPELFATTLASECYSNMFQGCTSLTTAPELPATTLASSCYQSMFQGCTSLTTAPELPATTLADWCYNNMFAGCTSLTTAPELPATTLTNYCYDYMFAGCTSLTTAPALPATTLANSCYYYMFKGCISLTTAPELPATTLAGDCYGNMFEGCTNLNYVKALFTSKQSNSLTNWLNGTASSGTFDKNPMASWTASDINLPDGWTITDTAA